MQPAFYYKMQNGILEQKLFSDGKCPEGWFDDKFKARSTVGNEPEYVEKRIVIEKIKPEDCATTTTTNNETLEVKKPRKKRAKAKTRKKTP